MFGLNQSMNLPNVRSSSAILEPGLWQINKGVERYIVPACGMIAIELHPDDILTVHNPEGAQTAEIVPFTAKGKGDPSLLGINKTLPAKGLQEILAGESESAIRVRNSFQKKGFDIASARATSTRTTASSAAAPWTTGPSGSWTSTTRPSPSGSRPPRRRASSTSGNWCARP